MLKKHRSLFTRIGGFDLAASWMGWENSIFSPEGFHASRLASGT